MPCLLKSCAHRKRANGSLRVWPSGKKGYRWQGNRSSLSRRLCWSTARHWWVPEESLEQTDGVAPYVSHKRRLSRNNTSMKMTCRSCNPGLPVCLALLPSASACRTFHIRQDNKQWLSLNCCETLFDPYCQDTKCVQREPSFLAPAFTHPLLTIFLYRMCDAGTGETVEVEGKDVLL